VAFVVELGLYSTKKDDLRGKLLRGNDIFTLKVGDLAVDLLRPEELSIFFDLVKEISI
jgi:hypothetical protein